MVPSIEAPLSDRCGTSREKPTVTASHPYSSNPKRDMRITLGIASAPVSEPPAGIRLGTCIARLVSGDNRRGTSGRPFSATEENDTWMSSHKPQLLQDGYRRNA